MRTFSNDLPLDYAQIDLDRLRHRIAAIVAIAILLFLCAGIVCAALGLVALAAGVIDADLTNQALLGLLAAIDGPPLDRYPFDPLA